MNLFISVKICLLISFLLISCSKKHEFYPLTKREAKIINSWQISPIFPCGIYVLKGKLIESDGNYKIILRDKTSTHLEFLILGGSIKERLSKLNTEVMVKVYNPLPIEDRSNPTVYLKSYLTYDPKAPDYEITEKRDCKLTSEFIPVY